MAVDNYYYSPTTVLKIQFIRYKEWTNSRRQPMLRSSVVQLHKEGARLDLGPRAPTRPPSCSSSSLSFSSLQSFRRWKCFVSLWRQIWGLNSCQSLVFEYAELLCCFFFSFSFFIFIYFSSSKYIAVCLFTCLLKELGSEHAKSHRLHLLDFSPLCVFKCLLKWLFWMDAKSHRLHLFDFSPLCVFKCVLKLPAWEDA